MNTDLIFIRLKSFATEAAVIVALGIVTALSSEEFATLLTEEFGAVWGGGVGVLLINGIVKHIMNIRAIQDYENKLGSAEEKAPPLLI